MHIKHTVMFDTPNGPGFYRNQWVPIGIARRWLAECTASLPPGASNPRIVTRTGKAVAKPYIARPTKRKLVPRNPDYRLV